MTPSGKRRRKQSTPRQTQCEINDDVETNMAISQLQCPKHLKKYLLVNLKMCNVKSVKILGQVIDALRD